MNFVVWATSEILRFAQDDIDLNLADRSEAVTAEKRRQDAGATAIVDAVRI
jgi:hypothetical protein